MQAIKEMQVTLPFTPKQKIATFVALFTITLLLPSDNRVLLFILRTYALVALCAIAAVYAQIWRIVVRTRNATEVRILEKGKINRVPTFKYDLKTLQKTLLIKTTIVCLVSFIHIKFGKLPPVLVAPTMNTLSLLEDPLFRLYILKQSPTQYNELRRPFAIKNRVKAE